MRDLQFCEVNKRKKDMADIKGNDNPGDEKHPMNVLENGEATVAINTRRQGCFITRIQTIAAVFIVVVALLLIGVLGGLIGREHCDCHSDPEVIALNTPNTSKAPARPTLDPSLPWSGIRLPRTLLPSHYHIVLQVDLDTFWFNGSVDITVSVTEPTKYVVVHVNNLVIAKSKLSVFNEKSKRRIGIVRTHSVPQNQLYVLETHEDLQKGQKYVVRFGGFKGELLDDLRGLYRSSYKTSQGKTRYLATSQLQSIDARKVFPCFDEPDLKAVFTVAIIHKQEYEAIANMPRARREVLGDGWVRDEFKPSPVMATYILAFVVADFRSREKTSADGNLKIRIWSQPDKYNQTAYALEFTEQAYAFFTEYFGIPEVLPKADHVAIPDFSAGAMENWGLVLYRETALLHDQSVSSEANRYWVSLVMAHEIAHTWFGNMVTMKWWDDLWLNEGFANTLMYFALDSIHKEWNVFDLQLVNNVWPVMTKDSLLTSHPISTPIKNPDDIPQYFDSISYDKGMSVLRLLRGFLGWNDFQKGLQNYIQKYKFRNAEMSELWHTFAEAVQGRYRVGEIMDTWTRQMGFPYVNVTRIEGTNMYMLKQKRFLLNPESTYDPNTSPYKYKWHIPFTFKFQGRTEIHTKWMRMGSAEIECPPNSWLLGNVDYMGFYRTNYDTEMWGRITKQLQKNHLVFSASNRAGLIDDAFNLARAGLLSYEIAFDLTSYLKNEDDYVPWRAFLDSMNFIKGMLATSDVYGTLAKYIEHLVADKHRAVGTAEDGTLLTRNLRRLMLKAAASVGVSDAVKYGRDKFNTWMTTGRIPADYAVVIYAVGIREGGEKEWNYLWGKAKESRVASESEIMMDALTHTREPWLLWRYARWSFNPTKIRMQDVRNLFSYFASTPLGRSVALQFLVTNWEEINKRFGMDVFLLRDIIYASTSLVNTDFEYNQLERLYKDHPPVGVASKAAENSLALIRSNINWMKRHLKTITLWLKKKNLS